MKTDTEREREKYSAVWTDPAYALRSPGLRHLPDALQWMKPESGASVTDWGSGSGQAADRLHELGYDVRMVDIAANSYKGKHSLPLTVCSLWELPDDLQETDYGICCDVMEHLPPDRIDEVLSGIAKRTGKAVYFQIALFHDNTFTENGPLHLSVFPIDWWKEKLLKHFSAAEFKTIKVKHILAVCKP